MIAGAPLSEIATRFGPCVQFTGEQLLLSELTTTAKSSARWGRSFRAHQRMKLTQFCCVIPPDDSLLPVVKKIGFVYSKRRDVNAMPIYEAGLRLIIQQEGGGASLLVRRQQNQEKRLGFLSCRISMPLKWKQVLITLARFFGAAMSLRAEAVRMVGHTAVHRRTVNSSLGTAERLPPLPGALVAT